MIQNKNNPIIWLTGQSGAGKTTLAKALKKAMGGVILDGDEMRKIISTDCSFSREDREKHNLRIDQLAKIISENSPVIIAVIAPFESTRKLIGKIIKPIWIYVENNNIKTSIKKPYEIPKNYDLKVNFYQQKTKKQIDLIKNLLK